METELEIVNALTVDVEDYFHVAALSSVIDREEWNALPLRVENSTRRLLDLFDSAGVRATFFILGWVAERLPGLIKSIHSRGHEIACHGLTHELVYRQSPDTFRAETVKAKRILEDLTGSSVDGYRAASYSITRQSWWALDTIAEAGFLYDSSIVPVRHDLYGVPDAQASAHLLTTSKGHSIVEFPPSTLSVFGARVPVAGGGYFRIYPYWLTSLLLRRVNNRVGMPFIFYLHPWELDPGQPRVNAGLRSRFRHYTNLDKTEGRLTRLLRDFRFDSARTILERLRLLGAA